MDARPPHESRPLESLRRRLLRWYRVEGRDTRDPWAVLLAELMLQRTRADLVPRVYQATMRRYPTAADFADAPAAELEVLLRPLGYHHRNARLQAAADACRRRVPRTMAGLLAVPGVGRYGATATLCFAYGRRLAVVDPSVIRVLGRLGLGESSRARPREDPSLWAAADELLPRNAARDWNYAVLDLGTLVCRPVPRCRECPLVDLCPSAHGAR
jgi:A/G-specific adenine glycosylase